MKILRLLAKETLWSLVIQIAPRFADVLLFILIGRMDGPYQAGIFSLAVVYLNIAIVAMRGPDDLVTRQVLRAPDRASAYFSSFFVLRLGITILIYSLLAWIVWGVLDYAPLTAKIISILALGLIPENLIGVAQAILLGQQRFDVPALTVMAVSLCKLGGGGAILLTGGSLSQVAVAWVLSSVVGMFVLVGYVLKTTGWTFPLDWQPISSHWRAILAFLVITVLLALESQADAILLAALRGEVHVGWYRAATTLTFSLAIFAQAYQVAAYPLMTRYAQDAPAKLATLYRMSVQLLGLFALPVVIAVWGMAPHLILLIFSPEFQPAVDVLRILIFSLLFLFLNAPNTRIMLVHNRQDKIVGFAATSVLANILFNLALAPMWGAKGTAIARLFSSALFFAFCYIFVRWRIIPRSEGEAVFLWSDIPNLVRKILKTASFRE